MAIPAFVLGHVQGDILAGLPKKTETFFFFKINDVFSFRVRLGQLMPLITPATQVVEDRAKLKQHKAAQRGDSQAPISRDLLPLSGINVAFSQFGLTTMGIGKVNVDPIGDPAFQAGMQADERNLGDQINANWIPGFKQQIHGVILITGNDRPTTAALLARVKAIFSNSIQEIISLIGDVRPGDQHAHEHFGFLDSISQPSVDGIAPPHNLGQQVVPKGTILCGRDGDNQTRPPWALDGSFLVFRHLSQHVPEFNSFLQARAIRLPLTEPPGHGAELLGARMIGRWKSGTPIDLKPIRDDDPSLGTDPARNNNFSYNIANDQTSQERCPFAAHIRKTNPRGDLKGIESHRIIRHGIQFGPEVSSNEADSGHTQNGVDRGLFFVSYQSSIMNGFRFLQQTWANNPGFIFGKPGPQPGFDPIIGQTSDPNTTLSMTGADPNAPNNSLNLAREWVVARGGEYFFSPSLTALQTTFVVPDVPPPP